ncbi:MAG: PAS domain S-box protein, partial [Deltaproteobacteria bacterium]|nr:PAS domain S-box protein [Deltaproteobacteria bacterium]
MASKREKDRIRETVEILSQAAKGDYSARLDFASKDDPVGSLAAAVNTLLDKTGKKISSISQSVEEPALDAGRYRNILDGIEETYFETDLSGRLLFFSGAAMRETGYAGKDLKGLHFRQLVDEANARKVYEAFHEVFVTGRTNKGFEWELLKKNKEPLDVESSIALLRDEKGEPVGFQGVIRDISRRKQTERDLRREEEKYRNILENMADTYLETDLKGNYLFFNDSLCRVLGYPREELQGINYRRLTPPERVEEVYREFKEIYTTGRGKTFVEHELIAGDGSTVYLEFSMSLLRSPEGEPIGFGGFGRDVTEKVRGRRKLEESERHLRLITDNISDIIWTMDFDLRFTYLGPSVFRITGFTPEEIMNIPFKGMVPPETYAYFKELLADKLSKAQVGTYSDKDRTLPFEIPMMRKDGSRLWIEGNVDFNRDENGRPFEIIGIGRDITERKRTEEKLRESEERYRMIAERMSDVVWIADMNLRTLYVTPSVQAVLGFTPEERMRQTVEEQLTPESLSYGLEALGQQLALEEEGKADPERKATLVLEYYHKDGSTRWMETLMTGIRDEQGILTGLYGVSRDVTDRREAEEALRESEARYKELINGMNETVWVIDFDGTLIDVNNAAVEMLGYSKEELFAIGLSGIDSTLKEDDIRALAHAMPSDGLQIFETSHTAKDGRTFPVEVYSSLVTYQGRPVILSIARDITERRKIQQALEESEKRYRVIVENVNDIIWTIGLDLRFIYVSPSNVRVSGYTREEVMTMSLQDMVAPESLDLATRMLAEELALEAGGEPFDPNRSRTLEVEIYRKDGTHVWLEADATFNRNPDGTPKEILAVGRDITERKRAEEALRASEELYRTAMETTNDGVSIVLDNRYVYANQKLLNTLGRPDEDLIGTPNGQFVHPDDWAGVLAAYERRPRGAPVPSNYDVRIIKPDGSMIYAHITSTKIMYQGRPAVLSFIVDVTERRQAEDQLRESEEKYRLLASYHQRLNDISIAFSEASGTDDLFNRISESLRLLTGAIAATFSWHDREAQDLRLASLSIDPAAADAVRSFFGPEILKEMNMPMSSVIAEEMITQGIRKPKDLCEL